MVRLQQLRRAFGGTLRDHGERRWLETTMGGLRVWVAYREHAGRRRYELAVFTPGANELAPFTNRRYVNEWYLEPRLALPKLQHGFVFAGCPGGVLLATYAGEPELEDLVGALWELGRWARETWMPPAEDPTAGHLRDRRRDAHIEVAKRLVVVALLALVIWLLRRPAPDLRPTMNMGECPENYKAGCFRPSV